MSKTIQWQAIPIPAGMRAIDHYRALLPLIEDAIGSMSGKTENFLLHCEPELFTILHCNDCFRPSSVYDEPDHLDLKCGKLRITQDLSRDNFDRVSYGVVKFNDTPVLEIILTNGNKKYS